MVRLQAWQPADAINVDARWDAVVGACVESLVRGVKD